MKLLPYVLIILNIWKSVKCNFFLQQDLRLPSVTTIAIPEGYNWKEMLSYIMKHHQMEFTGGLGPSVGMVSKRKVIALSRHICNCYLAMSISVIYLVDEDR